MQEIPENAADFAHFGSLHTRFAGFGPEMEKMGPIGNVIKHAWQPQWYPDEKESHIARLKLTIRLMFGKYEIPYTRTIADVRQVRFFFFNN